MSLLMGTGCAATPAQAPEHLHKVAAPAALDEDTTEGRRPDGCVTPNRQQALYAVELPRGDGPIRLGYGFSPDSASVPGPTIEMIEGECIALTLHNLISEATLAELRAQYSGSTSDLPLGVSLHVHGVKYTTDSDGTLHTDSWVPPGESRTYVWYAAPRAAVAGRVVSQGTAGYWWYHDHVVGTSHGTGGSGSGLFGAMIVRRPGDIKPDHTFTVALGRNATINHLKKSDFCAEVVPSNQCFAARRGERVEFAVIGIGDEFHTFHLHGHTWADNRTGILATQADETRLIDAKTIGPSETFGFQIIAGEEVGPGDWMLHCHVQAHSDAGMSTVLRVLNEDGTGVQAMGGHGGH